ncbi:MAG: YqaE/Pmp3 family membrane protein [Candidatus Limnocylindrales bacterium]
MKYVIAIIFPPLGMLLAGRAGQALVCLLLMVTLIGWPLAAIWALLVVNTAETEKRMRRLMQEQAKTSR